MIKRRAWQRKSEARPDLGAILLKLLKELEKGNVAIIDEVCSPNFHFQ